MHHVSPPGCYDFLGGTFFPSRLAFERPMAIACLGFFTFLPLRPDFSLPCFISRISVSTFLLAEGEYLRPEDFFEDVFFAEDFLVLVLRRLVLFLVLAPRLDEVLFRALADFLFLAFFVAMLILLENQMFFRFESVVWRWGRGCPDVFSISLTRCGNWVTQSAALQAGAPADPRRASRPCRRVRR
jgi:hypothetical protein